MHSIKKSKVNVNTSIIHDLLNLAYQKNVSWLLSSQFFCKRINLDFNKIFLFLEHYHSQCNLLTKKGGSLLMELPLNLFALKNSSLNFDLKYWWKLYVILLLGWYKKVLFCSVQNITGSRYMRMCAALLISEKWLGAGEGAKRHYVLSHKTLLIFAAALPLPCLWVEWSEMQWVKWVSEWSDV